MFFHRWVMVHSIRLEQTRIWRLVHMDHILRSSRRSRGLQGFNIYSRRGLVLIILGLCLTIMAYSKSAEPSEGDGLRIIPVWSSDQINESDVLDRPPLLGPDDIISYDWANHELHLSADAWKRVRQSITLEKIFDTIGIPFVMVIDSEKIYVGYFWSGLQARRPPGPFVLFEDIEEGRFLIGSPRKPTEVINDKRIHEWLVEEGKLHRSQD